MTDRLPTTAGTAPLTSGQEAESPDQAIAREKDAPDPPRDAPRQRPKRGMSHWGFVAGVATAVLTTLSVLAIAVGLLFATGMVPLTGLQHHVARLIEQRLGSSWSVATSKAAIQRVDGHATLRITDASFTHASGLRFRAPSAAVRYDPWSLLRGQFSVTGLDISGVHFRLRVDKDGALLLEAGDTPVSLPAQAPAEPDVPTRAIARLVSTAAELIGPSGPFPALDDVTLDGARLSLVAPDGAERVALEGLRISYRRGVNERALRLSGATPTGLKEVALIRRESGEGAAPVISAIIDSFRLDDVERLLMGRSGSVADGFPLQGQLSFSGEGARTVEGTLRLGKGQIMPPDSGVSIGTDIIATELRGDLMDGRIDIVSGRVEAGVTALDLRASARIGADMRWTLTGTAAGILAGEGFDPPQTLSGASFDLQGLGVREVELKAASLQGPRLSATGRARLWTMPDGQALTGELHARNSQVRALFAAWPRAVSPILRTILVDRLEAGEVRDMTIALDMPPAALLASRRGEVIPDESVRVKVAGQAVRFVVGPGLPKLEDAAVEAVATGRTLDVKASEAKARLDANRVLAFTEGTFRIDDTYAPRAPGRSTFRVTGTVDALAALMALPALRDNAPAQLDPASLKGRIDLRGSIALPLAEDLKASEVQVQAQGTMAALQAEGVFGDERFEDGTLMANYDRGALTLRGNGRIGGTAAQIDIRQDARGVGEAVVNLTLDQADRQRRGFAVAGVTGPMPVKVTKPIGRRQEQPARIEADLSRAAIEGLLPGWSKPAGRPGRLTFALMETPSGFDLSDIALDAAPVALRGRASLDEDGAARSASFSSFKLSPGDDLKIDFKIENAIRRVTVRGQVADARPFLRLVNSAPPPAGRRGVEKPMDFDLDLAVPILTGFNNEAVGNAALKISRRAGEVRQLEFSGRIGRAPVSITQSSREGEGRRLRVTSEDGGAFLRYLDIYRRAYGGDLVVNAVIDGDRAAGETLFTDFRVRGEPALRRVLGEQFAQAAGERAGAGTNRAAGEDVAFTKLKGEFVRTPSRVDIKDGVIIGNQVGVTGQGTIDYARDRVDIAGTFVPGFGLNNAFAQLPVLGPLLSGGQYGGLFAVNFRITGAASSPSMSINPLSAVAPGILRRFIDPLGGVPSGDLAGPRTGQGQGEGQGQGFGVPER